LKDMGCPTCFRALTRSISRHNRIWESLENPNADLSNLPPGAQGFYGNIHSMLNTNNFFIALWVGGALLVLIPVSCCCIYCKCIKHCGKCCDEVLDQFEELHAEGKAKGQQVKKGNETTERKVEVSIYQNQPSAPYELRTAQPASLETVDNSLYRKLTEGSKEGNIYPNIIDEFNDF